MLRSVFTSIVVIGLFGWAMVSMYDSQMQFAEIMKDPEPPWEMTIDLLPGAALVVIGGGLSFLAYLRERKKRKSWLKAIFLPMEFEEGDEREVIITGKATRAAYISMWIAAPVITALLLFYPFISHNVPYYPIIIFLLLPVIQVVTYAVTWRKHYKQ